MPRPDCTTGAALHSSTDGLSLRAHDVRLGAHAAYSTVLLHLHLVCCAPCVLLLQEWGLLEETKLKEVLKAADVAGKEFGIEVALDKMQAEWANLSLTVVPYRETGTSVIKACCCSCPELLPGFLQANGVVDGSR